MATTQPATLTTVLTCPICQHAHTKQMPTDACQYFYECPNRQILLKKLFKLI